MESDQTTSLPHGAYSTRFQFGVCIFNKALYKRGRPGLEIVLYVAIDIDWTMKSRKRVINKCIIPRTVEEYPLEHSEVLLQYSVPMYAYLGIVWTKSPATYVCSTALPCKVRRPDCSLHSTSMAETVGPYLGLSVL
jgi:hypothetical protein